MEIIKHNEIEIKNEENFEEEEMMEKKFGLIWLQEYIDRHNSLPNEISKQDIFKQLKLKLNNTDWEIRYHTLKLLNEIIPLIEHNENNNKEIMIDLLPTIVNNLGYIVPTVRKAALDLIIIYLKYNNNNTENILSILINELENTNNINLIINIIQYLPFILKIIKINNNLTHQLLSLVITSLSKKMIQITYQENIINCFNQIKNLLGETFFDHFLETYYPKVKRDFDVLSEVYTLTTTEDTVSEEGVDVESWEEEENEDMVKSKNEEEEKCEHDNVVMKIYDEDGNEIKRSSSRRVTFGGEVIKMRTPDSDTTTIVTQSNEKLDITANIIIEISKKDEEVKIVENTSKLHNKRLHSSHIPLPVTPALNLPKDPRASFRSQNVIEYEELLDIPTYDGGESFTSSSDSSDQIRINDNSLKRYQNMTRNILSDLYNMKITDRIILENLFSKDESMQYARALDRLSLALRQPDIIQNIMRNKNSTIGTSLLTYLINQLDNYDENNNHNNNNERTTINCMKSLRALCLAIPSKVLSCYLMTIMPTFCKYLSPIHSTSVRLENVENLKMLMQKLSPNSIVNVLFSNQCFYSKSSKMRENSLLCLMYALITFPSTEFNSKSLVNMLIENGVNEPKKRVRQALLDTLSILGQYLPRSQFQKIDIKDENSVAFRDALRARLTRRQLPVISPDGLILYAFQVSPSNAFGKDIEWILQGKGSTSLNCTRRQYSYSHTSYQTNYNNTRPNDEYKNYTENNNSLGNSFSKNENSKYVRKCAGSVEKLHSDSIFEIEDNAHKRYSAEFLDTKHTNISPLFIGNVYSRYLGNFSDNSSYASSSASEQNIQKLQSYESAVIQNEIANQQMEYYSSSYNNISKLPSKLESSKLGIPMHTGYSSAIELPTLNQNLYYSNNGDKKYNKQANERKEENPNISFKRSFGKSESKIKYKQIITNSNTNSSQDSDTSKQNEAKGRHNTKTDELSKFSFKNELLQNGNGDNGPENESNMNSLDTGQLDSFNDSMPLKHNKFLERKPGIRLKRSLTREIKIPQSSFDVNTDMGPFEHVKDGLCKTLIQLENADWESVVQGLQGVVRLSKHHNTQFMNNLHQYSTLVSKHIRSLRSQVSRAACFAALCIFNNVKKISDQDMEELSISLLSRTADTNKFLRADSNKALDAMIESVKFSKGTSFLVQKAAKHPNAVVRASTARLLTKLVKKHGAEEIMSSSKDIRNSVLNAAVKFLTDNNLETRSQAKELFSVLGKDKRLPGILADIVPRSLMCTVNKALYNIIRC